MTKFDNNESRPSHDRCVAGFLDLPGDKSEAAIFQDMHIKCTAPSARDTLLASLCQVVNSIHQHDRENEGKTGVLTYMAFASLDDDVRVRIMGRWKERGDMEAFIRRGAFWNKGKEGVARMEQRCYLPDGKGWLHRAGGFAGEVKSGGKL